MFALTLMTCTAVLQVGTPSPPSDYPHLEMIRSRIDSIAESENAWPFVLKALQLRRPGPSTTKDDPDGQEPAQLESEDWAKTSAWLQSNREYVAAIKELAKRRVVAHPISDALPAELSKLIGEPMGQASGSPLLLDAILPVPGIYRAMSRALIIEARDARSMNDHTRWSEALIAIFGLADQLFQGWTNIEQMVGFAIASRGYSEIRTSLGSSADSLPDPQLASLAGRIRQVNGGKAIGVNIAGDLLVARDFWDRIYETGKGEDARLTLDGFRALCKKFPDVGNLTLKPAAQSLAKQDGAASPPKSDSDWVSVSHSRGMLEREFSALATEWQRCALEPLWTGPCNPRKPTLQEGLKNLPILPFEPGVSRFRLIKAQGELERDSALLAIALCRYKLRTSEYPTSLASLVPEYVPQIPTDVYSGGAVLYVLKDGTPLVYARGVDQDDDQGEPMTRSNMPYPGDEWMTKPSAERPSGDYRMWPINTR
jgi:hypothetical protein